MAPSQFTLTRDVNLNEMREPSDLPKASKGNLYKTFVQRLTRGAENLYELMDKWSLDDGQIEYILQCSMEPVNATGAKGLVAELPKEATTLVLQIVGECHAVRVELYRLWRRPESAAHVRVLMRVLERTSPHLTAKYHCLFVAPTTTEHMLPVLTASERRKFEHIHAAHAVHRAEAYRQFGRDKLEAAKKVADSLARAAADYDKRVRAAGTASFLKGRRPVDLNTVTNNSGLVRSDSVPDMRVPHQRYPFGAPWQWPSSSDDSSTYAHLELQPYILLTHLQPRVQVSITEASRRRRQLSLTPPYAPAAAAEALKKRIRLRKKRVQPIAALLGGEPNQALLAREPAPRQRRTNPPHGPRPSRARPPCVSPIAPLPRTQPLHRRMCPQGTSSSTPPVAPDTPAAKIQAAITSIRHQIPDNLNNLDVWMTLRQLEDLVLEPRSVRSLRTGRSPVRRRMLMMPLPSHVRAGGSTGRVKRDRAQFRPRPPLVASGS